MKINVIEVYKSDEGASDSGQRNIKTILKL